MAFRIKFKNQNTENENLKEQIERVAGYIDEAEAVIIGAGAGLSTAAGFTYSGERFARYLGDFGAKYHYADMYSGGFYPYKKEEEMWAFWSRNIYINRYMKPMVRSEDGTEYNLYERLYEVVRNKEYFVITTNVDHCFQKVGFDKKRLYYTQGDYGLFQCSKPCHDSTYDNEKIVREMLLSQGFTIDEDGELIPPENADGTTDFTRLKMEIPSELIPHCPVCGRSMSMNLRADDTFVQDEGWYEAAERYADFLDKYRDKKIVFLELGVGFNTPGIIKYPFWHMTKQNEKTRLVCLNYDEASVPNEIEGQSICITHDAAKVISELKEVQSNSDIFF